MSTMVRTLLWLATYLVVGSAQAGESLPSFDGRRAHADVATIVNFGPRTLGSAAAAQTRRWVRERLSSLGWTVEESAFAVQDGVGVNLLAWRGEGPVDLVGTHYDTRAVADEDPDHSRRNRPGPGANDGGSGVAVLLELARTVRPAAARRLCLAFFDAEDDGRLAGRDWAEGSTAWVFAAAGEGHPCWPPRAAVIIDMVGDPAQIILREPSADPAIDRELREIASRLGYARRFPDRHGRPILDDHRPFVEAGIPAVLLIDFEDSRWHTHADLPTAVSPDSLEAVGRVLEAWLEGGRERIP